MVEELHRLVVQNTALLVVDIQERLMPFIHGRDGVCRNSALLVKAANVLHMPVIATTQYAQRIGPLLPEVAAELGSLAPLDKMEFSCFGNDAIRTRMASLDQRVNTLIICGVETHICIYQTVFGALQAGYRVWVAADAVSSRAVLNHDTGLARIRQIGGVVGNTEMIIYELLAKAGTREFKALLPSLK